MDKVQPDSGPAEASGGSLGDVWRDTIRRLEPGDVGALVEAARRAGISVDRIRIAIFALCSGSAASGGILAGSRLFAVNPLSGSGDVLLDAYTRSRRQISGRS